MAAAKKGDEVEVSNDSTESTHARLDVKPTAAKGKKVASAVYVGGQVFLPGDVPAPEFAALITNPKAWAGKGDDKAEEVAVDDADSGADN